MFKDPEIHKTGEIHPIPAHSVRQGLAWAIAADLVRRHPGQCRVIESHSHGYDLVTVLARSARGDADAIGNWRHVVDLNKEHHGHITTPASFSAESDLDRRLNWLDVLMVDDLRTDVVAQIEADAGLDHPPQTPETTEWSIGPRLLGRFAQREMFAPQPRTILSAMIDSDYGGTPRRQLLDQFGWLTTEPLPIDGGIEPEWRYWFVVDNADPLAVDVGDALMAVDSLQGIAFTPDKVIELLPEYRRLGNSIDRLVNAVCPQH